MFNYQIFYCDGHRIADFSAVWLIMHVTSAELHVISRLTHTIPNLSFVLQ